MHLNNAQIYKECIFGAPAFFLHQFDAFISFVPCTFSRHVVLSILKTKDFKLVAQMLLGMSA